MYQPNASHLHRHSVVAVPPTIVKTATARPPLPATKPPIKHASLIPTKMQNLDPSIVNTFLQTVNDQKPVQNGATNGQTPTSTPQTSYLWRAQERTISDAPVVLRTRNIPEVASTSSTTTNSPSWMNKPLKPSNNHKEGPKSPPWVKKQIEPQKPTWNAKTLEKPKIWSPQSSVTNGHPVNEEKTNGGPIKSHQSNGVKNEQQAAVLSKITIGGSDWHNKYEEAERKRKELLAETQKAAREKATLERRLNKLEADYQNLEADHREKSLQLNKLSRVSEKVYQDYDTLNNKYEVETSALHRALGAASKWYVENKKLRRQSVARANNEPYPIIDEVDGDHELDELRKTVQDLSTQVGQLQSELNRAKLQEFEAQEQYINVTQQLEEERQKSQKQNKELKELKLMREKFESVTIMVQGEVESLRHQKEKAKEEVRRLQGESHEAKKERNVLAHQSSLLMGDIGPDDRLFLVLMEVEDLKRKLEESEHKHDMEIQAMQESLEERQSDAHVEILEEKLKLAESELQLALERAEQAEQSLKEQKAQNVANSQSTNIPCAPPPPPPPPMPPMTGGPPVMKLTKHRPTEGDSLEDMARLLGIQRTPKPPSPQGGAIDNIINEIKGGKFTLKATEKVHVKKEEQPAAVQEMLSIIGTLKRQPKRNRIANGSLG